MSNPDRIFIFTGECTPETYRLSPASHRLPANVSDIEYIRADIARAQLAQAREQVERHATDYNTLRDRYDGLVDDMNQAAQKIAVAHVTEQQLRERLAGDERTIDLLRGQLQNCANHLDRAKRKMPYDAVFSAALESANNALYETLFPPVSIKPPKAEPEL